MFLIWKAGWNYGDLYRMPVTKRDWLFSTFVSLSERVMATPEEE
tara:strand:+ start:1922 stop:2053 length:132 start_codon:yes stop_codon:yes gene_type:complete